MRFFGRGAPDRGLAVIRGSLSSQSAGDELEHLTWLLGG